MIKFFRTDKIMVQEFSESASPLRTFTELIKLSQLYHSKEDGTSQTLPDISVKLGLPRGIVEMWYRTGTINLDPSTPEANKIMKLFKDRWGNWGKNESTAYYYHKLKMALGWELDDSDIRRMNEYEMKKRTQETKAEPHPKTPTHPSDRTFVPFSREEQETRSSSASPVRPQVYVAKAAIQERRIVPATLAKKPLSPQTAPRPQRSVSRDAEPVPQILPEQLSERLKRKRCISGINGGELLKQSRIQANLTQAQLAEQSGVPRSDIIHFENNNLSKLWIYIGDIIKVLNPDPEKTVLLNAIALDAKTEYLEKVPLDREQAIRVINIALRNHSQVTGSELLEAFMVRANISHEKLAEKAGISRRQIGTLLSGAPKTLYQYVEILSDTLAALPNSRFTPADKELFWQCTLSKELTLIANANKGEDVPLGDLMLAYTKKAHFQGNDLALRMGVDASKISLYLKGHIPDNRVESFAMVCGLLPDEKQNLIERLEHEKSKKTTAVTHEHCEGEQPHYGCGLPPPPRNPGRGAHNKVKPVL